MKKKILSILSALTLGFTFTQVSSVNAQTTTSTQPQEVETQPETTLRKINHSLPENFETGYEDHGFKYKNDSVYPKKVFAQTHSTPDKVEELVLFYNLNSKSVDYAEVDFSAYTNLKRVVIMNADPTPLYEKLKLIPNEFDLYLAGTPTLNENAVSCKIKSITLAAPVDVYGAQTFYDTSLESLK